MMLFSLSVTWLLHETELRRYLAYVRVPLLGYYRAFGAKAYGEPFKIPERGDGDYILVGGLLEEGANATRTYLGDWPEMTKTEVVARL